MTNLRVGAARGDIGAGIIIALFCLWALYVTLGFDPPALEGFPGAAFFPQLILIALLALAGALLVRGVIRSRQTAPADSSKAQAGNKKPYEFDLVPFLLSLGGVLVLLVAMQWIGMEIATTVYLGILLWLGTRRPLWSAIMAVAGAAVMYVVFVHMLNVHLPLLFLPRYL